MSAEPILCLVSPQLEPKLTARLREHYEADGVEVMVERRRGDRRSRGERRADDLGPPGGVAERRLIRNQGGRRVGERRAALIATEPPRELPRPARRYAGEIAFYERVPLPEERAEDLDTARLVTRIQAGEGDRFAILYERYFDRVYAYLRVMLKDVHEAEDATQQVFIQVFEALARYERRSQPFRAWLFTIARNYASRLLQRRSRVDVVDPAQIATRRDETPARENGVWEVSWFSDVDLSVLIDRLPEVQRQVLALRYMLDLEIAEIAEVLDCSPNHVSVMHYRALGFLRTRMTALGRRPAGRRAKPAMRRVAQHARILRRRRYALSP